MFRKKSLLVLMMATIVLSFCVVPTMAVTSVADIWTSPQIQGSMTRDYYKTVTSTGLPDPYYDRHIGRVDIVYKVKYITNDDPYYDYYSVAIQQSVTPAIAMSGDEYDVAKITSGIIYFKFQDDDQLIKSMLPYSGTTGTCKYGISAQVGNGNADFTTTGTLSIPDVFVAGYKSTYYGSTNNWVKFVCNSNSYDDANTYRWTVLIKVREGGDLHVSLVFKSSWQTSSIFPGFPIYPVYEETVNVQFDGTPSSGGGGGGGIVFIP
ncbi:hypothetical protein EU527_08020 [Candidatus Thorarchaeota archaeon]|nr:MAG: hypothetical protein EU527_08020 [Candidatus Thorarchaeota archaeon]